MSVPFVKRTLINAQPINRDGMRVTPVSEHWELSLPGLNTTLNWSRPLEVKVVPRPGGSVHRLPVPDPTRRAQMVALAIMGLCTILMWNRYRGS